MANSLDPATKSADNAGTKNFQRDLEKLMDAISAQSTNRAVRFVLLSPIRHEDLGRPLPDPGPHNDLLSRYDKTLRAIAEKRGCAFVSLFDLRPARGAKLTENGIHLSPLGYAAAAGYI